MGDRGRPVRPLWDRVWEKVDRSGECWLWTGSTDEHGYGQVWDHAAKHHRKSIRVVWELTRGPLPEWAVILHACDTPACVRPTHLQAGDQALNMQDAAQKGRMHRGPGKVYGDRHHRTKVPDAEIGVIVQRRMAGERPTDLAREYGVTYNTIWNITTGKYRRRAMQEVNP